MHDAAPGSTTPASASPQSSQSARARILTNEASRPPHVKIVMSSVPLDIRKGRFVNWDYRWNGKKWAKVPVDKSGRQISSMDPENYTSFCGAVSTANNSNIGINYVFQGDGITGVDIDDCRDPETGVITPWAQSIIDTLSTYAEVSPSGTGVKMWLRGDLPDNSLREFKHPSKIGGVEVYGNKKTFAVTGLHVTGTPEKVEDRQWELLKVYDEIKPWGVVEKPAGTQSTSSASTSPSATQSPPKKIRPLRNDPEEDRETALAALAVLDPSSSNRDWVMIGMGLHSVDSGSSMCAEWESWSRGCPDKFVEGECQRRWASFKSDGSGAKIGTLIHMANQVSASWKPQRKRKATDQRGRSRTPPSPAEIIAKLPEDCPVDHTLFELEQQTDIFLSERFVSMYRDKIRYVPEWGQFIAWDGVRWKVDNTGIIFTFVSLFSKYIWEQSKLIPAEYDDHGNEKPSPLNTLAKKVSSKQFAIDVVFLAKTHRDMVISSTQLNLNPDVVNCLNGTIELRTGELRPHRQDDFLTQMCSVIYNPVAECPLWIKFANKVMGDDYEFVEFIQTFYGYALTGHTNEHKVMIFYGDGGNGKSLLTNTAIDVIGKDYCHQAPSDLLVDKNKNEHPTILAGLFARRLVCCSETGDGARLNQPLLKLLSGGDAVTARKMHQDFWEFKPTHKLVILTNHKPVVKANDDGIWRRLILVPFIQHFWDEEKGEDGPAEFKADKDLGKKMVHEREGIFRWFVEGARRWYEKGLKIPVIVQTATNEYKDEEDIFGKFLEEQCVVGQPFRVKFSALYEEYSKWCDASNEYPIKKRALSALLKSRKFIDQQSDGLWFLGLGLRETHRTKREDREQESPSDDYGFSDTANHTATSTLF